MTFHPLIFLESSPFFSRISIILGFFLVSPLKKTTVDGRNPAKPPGMYKTLVNNGINYLSTGAGFLPSTVVTTFQPRNSGNPQKK